MDAETWSIIQDLFERALDAPANQRDAMLSDETISPEIRARVESMLRHAEDDTGLGEEPASELADVIQSAMSDLVHAPVQAGTRVGRYSVLRLIASGGMGDVYLAHSADGELDIPVAIKISRRVGVHTRSTDRFSFEREVLLRLDHPEIPKIIDTGTTDGGLPFFVMEYVDGRPIDQFCQSHALSTHQRVHLIRQVCDAIHHAHQRLVIHRDIKPSNILVRQDGMPRVLDFGIASEIGQTLEHARLTKTGEFVGTLAYASPEQLDGSITPDTRSDVYSLGVVLYELLTESLPHSKTTSLPMLLDQIRNARPPSPSVLNPGIDSDLSAVVMQAIALDPDRRYQSVADFGADLQNFIEDRPVHAREDSRWYVIRSEIKLRRVPILVTLAVLAMSIAFSIYASTQSRELADRNAALLDALSRESVERAGLLAQSGSLVGAERLLWPLHREGSDRAHWALRDLYTRYPVLASALTSGDLDEATVLDGQTLLISDGSTSTIHQLDLIEARSSAIWTMEDAATYALDHNLVAWITFDGSVHTSRLDTPTQRADFGHFPLLDRDILIGTYGTERLPWILSDGDLWIFQDQNQEWITIDPVESASVLQVQSTEAGLVILTDDLQLSRLDPTGVETDSMESGPIGRSRSMIIASSDQSSIAQITDSDITLFHQDLPPARLQGANGWIEAACFVGTAPEPGFLVACSADKLLRVWRLDTSEIVLECNAFDSMPTHVIPMPAGNGFATVEESGLIRTWDLTQTTAFLPSNNSDETALSLEIDPSSQTIALGIDGSPHRFELINIDTQEMHAQMTWDAPVCATAPGNELNTWFIADYQGIVARIQLTPSGPVVDWRTQMDQRPNALTLSPDGDAIAIACDKGKIEILDSSDGTSRSTVTLDALRIPSVDWGINNGMIVACTYPESDLVAILNPAESPEVRVLHDGEPQQGARVVTLSPDGKQIAMSGDDALIRVWELQEDGTLEILYTLRDHSEGLFSLDYSRSGHHLVSAGRSGRVIVWDTRSGEPLARIDASERMLFSARMSRDESSVLTTGIGRRIYEWDIASMDNRIRLHHHKRRSAAISHSSDE